VKTYLLVLVSVASWQLGCEQGPSGSTGRWVYIPCLVVENSVLVFRSKSNISGGPGSSLPTPSLSVILCSVLTPAATRRRPRDTTIPSQNPRRRFAVAGSSCSSAAETLLAPRPGLASHAWRRRCSSAPRGGGSSRPLSDLWAPAYSRHVLPMCAQNGVIL